MKFKIILDTCFWIALFDPRDDIHRNEIASKIAEQINDELLLIPFPSLYEFLKSRLSRRDEKARFENILRKTNVIKVDDSIYRDEALANFFSKSHLEYGDVSLVDEVIKLIIERNPEPIDYIVSFDEALVNEAISRGIRDLISHL